MEWGHWANVYLQFAENAFLLLYIVGIFLLLLDYTTSFYSAQGIVSIAIDCSHFLAVVLIVPPVDGICSEEEVTLFNLCFDEDQVYI
jgi:hypothetical protein